ncbi:MAG: hypothetical protein QW613_03855 [Thermoprotei archaeon]
MWPDTYEYSGIVISVSMVGGGVWDIDGFRVRLVRQDEVEAGVVLHFEVEKPVAAQREGLPLHLGLLGRKKPDKKARIQTNTGENPAASFELQVDKDFLVKYSRVDSVSNSVVVGVYVHSEVDKGTPADEYNQRIQQLVYEAAKIAVEESKKQGLN